jgi:hypothetical protein
MLIPGGCVAWSMRCSIAVAPCSAACKRCRTGSDDSCRCCRRLTYQASARCRMLSLQANSKLLRRKLIICSGSRCRVPRCCSCGRRGNALSNVKAHRMVCATTLGRQLMQHLGAIKTTRVDDHTTILPGLALFYARDSQTQGMARHASSAVSAYSRCGAAC